VLLAMGRASDGAAFHGEAARVHRQLGDRWQEAVATMHLAGCERALGHASAAREQAGQALALMRDFGDDHAATLRAALREQLA
jgi:hypothetical protein